MNKNKLIKIKEYNHFCKTKFHKTKTKVIDIIKDEKWDHNHLLINCPKHGESKITIYALLKKREFDPCVFCNREIFKRNQYNEYTNKGKKVHHNLYKYPKYEESGYINTMGKIKIFCPKHGYFFNSLFDHVTCQTRCAKCVWDDKKDSVETYIAKAIKKHGNKYLYNKISKDSLNTNYIEIGCPKHGYFIQRKSSHLEGIGCPKCALDSCRSTSAEFAAKAREVHGDAYDYSKVNYINNKTKVIVICPRHGEFKVRPDQHLYGKTGCPKCVESFGERTLKRLLNKYKLNYLTEYKFKDSNYRFDFKLKDLNILIEFHGVQHYRPVKRFGGEKAFEQVRERDENKKYLAMENNHHLIVLNFIDLKNNVLENKLISKLKEIYGYYLLSKSRNIAYDYWRDFYKDFNIPYNIELNEVNNYCKNNNIDLELINIH